jgi:hypothetical protein
MEYQGVTYRLFATLSEGHPSVPFLKEVLWEHQEQRKRDTMALEHALRLQLAQEEAKKNNDHLSLLHALLGKKDSEVYFAKKALQKKEKELTKLQNQLNERRNQFFEWTRNTEKVSELAKKAGLLRNG